MPCRRASSSRRQQDLRADAPTAQPGKYRDATDLTGGVQAPGANWVTVQAGEDVNASGILGIPLVFFGYLLLFDENGAADALEHGAVRVPVGQHAFHLRLRHGRPPQVARASASARPVYEAGVSFSSRSRAASGRPSVATNSRSSAAPMPRPRVNSFSFS